jgi:DNA-binding NtrC family response regulator
MLSIEELTKRHIVRALKHTQGNRTETAKILGVSRTTLYQLMADMEKDRTEKESTSGI